MSAHGRFFSSGAGFAVLSTASEQVAKLFCRGTFRGPAQISASVWRPDTLNAAQQVHQETGTLIEASVGILAVTMLITAIVTRSWLYLAFVGWLLLNMRMAGPAGTDFQLLICIESHTAD